MKDFIKYLFFLLVGYLLLLEVTTRVFGISAHTMPESNVDGNKLLTPFTEGQWIAGGKHEINSHYKINKQGFNSTKDYTRTNDGKISIAIIGDSYIEGLHVDVENSIGRQIEQMTNQTIEVHEYGKSEANVVDFALMYEQWIKNKYDYTFVLMTNRDLLFHHSAIMGKGHTIPKNNNTRKLYKHLSSVRYLNINHKLGLKFKRLISQRRKNQTKQIKHKRKLNLSVLERFDNSTIILYEKNKLEALQLQNLHLTTLEVKHPTYPYNCGFDHHWNINGRTNCALSIVEYLNNTQSLQNK